MKSGIELIAEERKRQVEVEGWDESHDDNHDEGQLAIAAGCYMNGHPYGWPWEIKWWKQSTPLRNKIKAGALYQAEIDRLIRLRDKCAAAIDRINSIA